MDADPQSGPAVFDPAVRGEIGRLLGSGISPALA
jgi:hypothetical protein